MALYLFNISRLAEGKGVAKNGEGEVLLEFSLSEDAYYSLEGEYGIFHIEVKDGKCRAIDVDCPNQICVHAGWISPGDPRAIICLPNNIAVTIDEE